MEEVSFLHLFFGHFLVYADIKDHETNNSSCLIIFHHVSSKSSNQEEIPNLTESGGSKYGVPQGYGLVFFGHFLVYKYRLQKRLGRIIEKCEELGANQSTKLEIASEMRENENKKNK